MDRWYPDHHIPHPGSSLNKGNPYTQTSSEEHQQYERSSQYFSPKLTTSVEMLINENYLDGLWDTEV